MKIANSIQQSATPLYQHLLTLIPLLKVIEDSRKLGVKRITPLRLVATHRPSGKLTIALTEVHQSSDGGDEPEMTIAIHSTTQNSTPLTYQDTYIFAWTYLCSISALNDAERETMYQRFLNAWATYVMGHEQSIKEMGLQ